MRLPHSRGADLISDPYEYGKRFAARGAGRASASRPVGLARPRGMRGVARRVGASRSLGGASRPGMADDARESDHGAHTDRTSASARGDRPYRGVTHSGTRRAGRAGGSGGGTPSRPGSSSEAGST